MVILVVLKNIIEIGVDPSDIKNLSTKLEYNLYRYCVKFRKPLAN
jgi:hypothetical protein